MNSQKDNSFEEDNTHLVEEIKQNLQHNGDEDEDADIEEEDDFSMPVIRSLHKSVASFNNKSQQSKKEKLRELFLKYSEISTKTGIASLKSRQFLRLFQDSGLIDYNPKLSKSSIDIMYSSFTKAKRGFMEFEVFLKCLIKVAEIVYPDIVKEKKSKAVEQLALQWLLPLQQTSKPRGTFITYDLRSKELLRSLFPILKDIYDRYFGIPFKAARKYESITQMTTKLLLDFLRDFDLIKNFVQKSLALAMLEQLVNTTDENLTGSKIPVFNEVGEDYGCYFTLARFFVFLLWTALSGFNAIRSDYANYTNAEKLFFMFAKMEISTGFLNLYKHTPKNPSIQHTLIPPSYILDEVIINNPLTPEIQYVQDKEIENQEAIELQAVSNLLQKHFIWYSSMNDNGNINKIPLTRFLMFVKDTGLLKCITNTEAELIFVKVTGKTGLLKEGGKMDFNAFYYAVTLIAEKVYPNTPTSKALIALTESNIKAIESKNDGVEKNTELLKEMFEKLREEEVIELLSWTSKTIKPYFSLYTHKKGIMNYETFFKFCRDFGIFPEMCSKIILHTTFYALSSINSQLTETIRYLNVEGVLEVKQSEEYLDENLFVEALALCALRSKVIDKNCGSVEHILHFLEKIAQSQGIIDAKKKMGNTRVASGDIDPLLYLRQKYSKYFEKVSPPNDSEEVLDEALNNNL